MSVRATHTELTSRRVSAREFPMVRKRDGNMVMFDAGRISNAIESAFRSVLDVPVERELMPHDRTNIDTVLKVVLGILEQVKAIKPLDVETIQDAV